jgi:hypothetical protein
MTLSRHIQILKLGIAVAALAFIGVCIISWKIVPLFPNLIKNAQGRSEFSYIINLLPGEAPYTAYVTVLAALIYALLTLIFIYYLFEKTQSVEVHFFIFFVFSFVFEALRLGIPSRIAFNLPGLLLGFSARTLVFCRFFGVFSLFTASLFSAGLKIEKEEAVLFPLIIITLCLSMTVPINTFTYDTTLCLSNGYPVIFRVMTGLVAFFSALSFFYGAWQSGTKEYYIIGAGALLAFIGRNFLLDADFYLLAAAGFILLGAGSCIICLYLRKLYLWA